MKNLSIIKIGGNVIDDGEALRQFLQNFAALPGQKMLVHGGGKIATEVAASLGIPARMIEGRRVTDADMLRVVTMVYGGLLSKTIVAQLQACGCNAVGLTGADACVIAARKRTGWAAEYGFVGDITAVNADALQHFLESGLTPVLAPLTHDGQGTLLNTNADTIAAEVAAAMAASYRVELIYCFEKPGVLAEPADEASVIPLITPGSYAALKTGGVISAGMIPKLDNAFAALNRGVAEVRICRAAELQNPAGGTRLVEGEE